MVEVSVQALAMHIASRKGNWEMERISKEEIHPVTDSPFSVADHLVFESKVVVFIFLFRYLLEEDDGVNRVE